MKKIFSKKYFVTLTSSFAVGTGIILACAGDWGPEYGDSSFTPEAFVNDAYQPFFYSDMFYYGIGHDRQHNTRFNESNIKDWANYLGNGTSRTELEFLLVNAPAETIDSLAAYQAGRLKTLPLSVRSFSLFRKNDKKTADFLRYLALAKKSEAFAVNNLEYSWDYESKKKPVNINTAQLNKELLQEFTQTKDAFLKQRYWFQLERSYFFNGPAQSALDLFEKNEASFEKNEMYYRTMAYAAGACYKLKNFPKGSYYYSKVYDGCDALKTVAHWSFGPKEENEWKATLALCANNDEKATLWQMLGTFYTDEKRAIQEIYNLNPHSEKLNLLLTRAVNKQEQKFSTWDKDYTSKSLQFKKDTSTSELLALVTRIAQAGNTHQPYMWHIAAGYLNMLNGNFQQAATAYTAAGKKLPKEELVQYQLRLLKLVNTVASTPKADSKLENKVLADLNWLQKLKTPDGTFRYNTAFQWIKSTLADRYIKQKEFLKAVCFNNYLSFYTNDGNIEAMKSFLNKANKTPYETLCASFYPLTTNDLNEYQAIRLTYDDQLDEAIAKMETVPASAPLPGNPFNGRLQDCHDCDHEAPQKIKYTKLDLLKKMKEMEEKIKTNSEVYSNAMLVANAFYNLTHYGNARAFYENNIVGSSHYSPFAIDSVFRDFLIDMKLATKYYTLALNAAKTAEQKAKCHYMLAKCERNQWYNQTLYNNPKYQYGDHARLPDFLPWNGFKALKQQYANTQFYKEAIRECGYLSTYAQQ
ncbi:hypothetical protein [Longitalea luteola]|uniref:hypothetical protein n=1 Tax=Longitalea luteola TaxID=2812563 RepID=UPI001A97CFAC|nr:hypothetical protein [Longitalea luteola]